MKDVRQSPTSDQFLTIFYYYYFIFSLLFCVLKVFIDSNGDAEGNYTVVSMLPFHGKRSEASASDDTMTYVMQPVGYFQYNSSSNSPNDLPVSLFFFPVISTIFGL